MLLSWGEQGALNHILVDGGRTATYPFAFERLTEIKAAGEKLHLLVLTHIDGDHIGGALTYLKDRRRPVDPENVWYNGYWQIRGSGSRSMRQGDSFSDLLAGLGWKLNSHFASGVVSIDSIPQDIEIADLSIRILSPTGAGLRALGAEWERWRHKEAEEQDEASKEGFRSGKDRKPPISDPPVIEDLIADGGSDVELANGSSIAFLAEWRGIRVLLAGDAHPDVLVDAIRPLAESEGGRLRVDLLKASHHGSSKNTSRELVELLDCRNLAISTNGAIHQHPDPESIARFIHFGVAGSKCVHFNYATPRTLPWGSAEAQQRYDYAAVFPDEGSDGMIEIDLCALAAERAPLH